MIADGAPLHQYFGLSADKVSHLLPRTGDQCRFYIPTAAGNRVPPNVMLEPEDVNNLVRELGAELDDAYDTAYADPHTFRTFLESWVEKYAGRQVAHREGRREPWHIMRIGLPAGTRADIAMFSVRTPNQQDWPAHLRSPPVNPKFSSHTHSPRLHAAHRSGVREEVQPEFRSGTSQKWRLNIVAVAYERRIRRLGR